MQGGKVGSKVGDADDGKAVGPVVCIVRRIHFSSSSSSSSIFFCFFFGGGGHLTSILSKGLQCNLFILYFMLTWPTPMTHWCFQRHVCLVDALSSDKKAGKDPNMQALICTIFKGYTGEMLFKFKDEVDTVAQKNMSELVFTVITDVSLQEELLDYFKVEAETLFDEPGTVLIQFNACCTNKGAVFYFIIIFIYTFRELLGKPTYSQITLAPFCESWLGLNFQRMLACAIPLTFFFLFF